MSSISPDTCVIGAGPAGLAVARALTERQLPYTHLERHTALGGVLDIDSPGSPMYESAHFKLTERIEFGTEVSGVDKNADGTWTVTRADGRQTVHSHVVVRTGSQWHPNIPDLPGNFTGEIRHAVDYRSPDELPTFLIPAWSRVSRSS